MLGQVTILEVTRRILKLIPDNPKILQFKTAWDLFFDVPGFDISDLQIPFSQVAQALVYAQTRYEEEKTMSDDPQMIEYERYLKHSKEFNAWRDRAIEQLPALAARVFALRKPFYTGCGFHYSLEKTLGFLLWKLNDFQAYPLDLREMVAHHMALKVHLDGLFKSVIAAEKSVAARMKL